MNLKYTIHIVPAFLLVLSCIPEHPDGDSLPGITVDHTGGLMTTEAGGTDAFTVMLNTFNYWQVVVY